MDFSRGGEPIGARACLEYWLGVAEAKGIAVEVFGRGDVFKTYQLLRSDKQYGPEDVHLVEEDYSHITRVIERVAGRVG